MTVDQEIAALIDRVDDDLFGIMQAVAAEAPQFTADQTYDLFRGMALAFLGEGGTPAEVAELAGHRLGERALVYYRYLGAP